MNIPNYVKSLLKGARYEFGSWRKNPNYAVGYTISIRKRSDY